MASGEKREKTVVVVVVVVLVAAHLRNVLYLFVSSSPVKVFKRVHFKGWICINCYILQTAHETGGIQRKRERMADSLFRKHKNTRSVMLFSSILRWRLFLC